MDNQIDKYLVAPLAAQKHMLINSGISLVQNFGICLLYFKYQIDDRLPFGCGGIQSSFLAFMVFLNMIVGIMKVLFMPQLMFIIHYKTKRERVYNLRIILRSRLYTYICTIQSIIFYIYILEFVFILFDLLFQWSEQCHEESILRQFITWMIVINILRFFIITYWQLRILEKEVIKESQEDFIHKFIYKGKYLSNNQESCSICLQVFEHQQQLAEYLCQGQHVYHLTCIEGWLREGTNYKKSCPYCKQLPTHYN